MCSPDECPMENRNVVFLTKIIGIKVSHAFFDYLCYYIPTHRMHIYLILCILYDICIYNILIYIYDNFVCLRLSCLF